MADIDIIGETKTLEDYWEDRNKQLKIDRATINLKQPIQTSAQKKWVSNEPKVFYDTAVALVSSYPARYRLPLDVNYSPEQKQKINKAERFISGIFRSLDHRQYSRGQGYWLRELAYWMMSGWYSVFNLVQETPNGVEFIADLWDPITVYPEWDADGLTKCIRSYEVDKKTALSMLYKWQNQGLYKEFREPRDDTPIKIINYWRQDREKDKIVVKNAILVGGQVVKDLTIEKFKRIPIHIGTVGIPERDSVDWKSRFGENIVASNRDIYDYTNSIVSLMVTIIAETAYPNIVTQTQTGAPAVRAEDIRGYGEVIPLRLSDKIQLLKNASTPTEVLQILSWLLKQQQKGSFPDVVYGGITQEISGFAISQLMAAIKYKISPYLNSMQYVLKEISEDFLTQYKDGKFPKVSLTTTNPEEIKKGLFFVEEFSRGDVPDAINVEVTIPITSALDKTQQIMFARQALQAPQILSRETLWDGYLDIQDSEQEYTRIIQDQMLELPVVKQIAIIEELRERVRFYEMRGKFAEAKALEGYIQMLEVQAGIRQAPPAGQEGVPPSVMPPEMSGKSPDQTRAALGVPPPGLSRSPETPERRAEKKAGMASIISPTGETLIP